MVWRTQELTAEDLKKAGLDPADLAEMKANGVKKGDLDAFKTETTNALTAISDSIKALEGKIGQPIKREPEQRNQEEQPDEQTEFLTDPVAFTKKLSANAVGFSALQNTKLRMELALDRAVATLKGFRNPILKEEILTEWKKYKPENFAMNQNFNPDELLGQVHDMIIGRHHEEIQRDTDKREGKFNLVASTSGGGAGNVTNNTNNTSTKPEDQMTDIEKKQAARYGMTPEQWIQAGKDMEAEEVKVMTGQGV